jgi:hypothetical protein
MPTQFVMARDLLNSRMACVSVSLGAHDAQLFTNNREKLPAALGHEVSRDSAHKPEQSIAGDRATPRAGAGPWNGFLKTTCPEYLKHSPTGPCMSGLPKAPRERLRPWHTDMMGQNLSAIPGQVGTITPNVDNRTSRKETAPEFSPRAAPIRAL